MVSVTRGVTLLAQSDFSKLNLGKKAFVELEECDPEVMVVMFLPQGESWCMSEKNERERELCTCHLSYFPFIGISVFFFFFPPMNFMWE